MKLSENEIIDLIESCTYKPGWCVMHGKDKGEDGRMFIQVAVSVEAEASMNSSGPLKGKREPWKGGKFYLSPFMCRQEIVSAVYGLIERAELHEIREWFRYKGASIFNPHLDPDVLAEIARKKSSFNLRENAMTMEEPK